MSHNEFDESWAEASDVMSVPFLAETKRAVSRVGLAKKENKSLQTSLEENTMWQNVGRDLLRQILV